MTIVNQKSRITAAFLAIFLCTTLFVLCFSFPQAFAETNSSSSNWPMYQNGAAHTGYSETTTTPVATQLWNFTIDVNSGSSPASPSVVGGYVYVGSGDYSIYCFDAVTGAKVWSYPTGYYASSTPAVVDGRVYAGSADGNLYCLDASSGSKIWSFSVQQQGQSSASADSSPTVVGDRVYIESGAGDIFCLDAASGDKVWSYSTGAASTGASPAVDAGYVYAGNGAGGVFCLDASSGAKIWDYSTGDAVDSPAVVDGYVYVGSVDGNVYCLRASDGAKIWNYTTEYNSNGPAHNYHWGNAVSDPAVAYGNVYVGSSGFLIYCLDAASGSQIWNFTANAQVYAAPIVAADCVLAGSYDGNLYCLNSTDGSEIWSFPAGVFSPVNAGGSVGSPSIADGVVYVVGNGVLYALGTQSSGSSSSLTSAIVIAVVVAVMIIVAAIAYVKSAKGKKPA